MGKPRLNRSAKMREVSARIHIIPVDPVGVRWPQGRPREPFQFRSGECRHCRRRYSWLEGEETFGQCGYCAGTVPYCVRCDEVRR